MSLSGGRKDPLCKAVDVWSAGTEAQAPQRYLCWKYLSNIVSSCLPRHLIGLDHQWEDIVVMGSGIQTNARNTQPNKRKTGASAAQRAANSPLRNLPIRQLLYATRRWPQSWQPSIWPPSAAVRQVSIADITLSWARLTWPAFAARQPGPWMRKISATSSGGRTRISHRDHCLPSAAGDSRADSSPRGSSWWRRGHKLNVLQHICSIAHSNST